MSEETDNFDKIPKPEAPEHPLRCSIQGDTHLKEELKKLVDASEIPESLKVFVREELDEIETNAATIDLHLLDNANGSTTLNLHISPMHLGSRKISKVD